MNVSCNTLPLCNRRVVFVSIVKLILRVFLLHAPNAPAYLISLYTSGPTLVGTKKLTVYGGRFCLPADYPGISLFWGSFCRSTRAGAHEDFRYRSMAKKTASENDQQYTMPKASV